MSARHQAPTNNTPPLLTACTRFNNKTWQEYQDWKAQNQQVYEQIYQRPLKCIYGCPREMSHKKMPPHAKILVIEMNNDENKIKGIGVIQNQTAREVYRTPPPVPDLPPRIIFNKLFSDRNYTRYIYIGNEYYATKEELERNHTADAQYINEHLATLIIQQAPPAEPPSPAPPPAPTIIQSLERLLFKGAKHMKRGSGITLLMLSCSIAPLLRNSAIPQLRANAAQ